MKLLAKYNRANILVTVLVLVLSAFIYYFFVEEALKHQADKSLIAEEQEITEYVYENHQLPEPSQTKEEIETYTRLNTSGLKREFSSINMSVKGAHHKISYRRLTFPLSVNGITYKIEVNKSLENSEHLVKLILFITLGMVLLLLGTLFVINRLVLNKIWKPFNVTLSKIRNFNVASQQTINPEPTQIDEFAELNHAIAQMTQKVSSDYSEIKSFTENASHEIQTPLAIIKSKLELLSQDEGLNADQMEMIQSVAANSNRLSRLNQSLILLTKLENRQFAKMETISLSDILTTHLANYEELFTAKGIHLSKNIKSDVKIFLNEALADILITNLLTNAIKHNVPNGNIDVSLSQHYLTIGNPGKPMTSDPSRLFERFQKESPAGDSLGLGLSIVKKICDIYRFNIKYTVSDAYHLISIGFAGS
jgi:signal transduction histidine kinase